MVGRENAETKFSVKSIELVLLRIASQTRFIGALVSACARNDYVALNDVFCILVRH